MAINMAIILVIILVIILAINMVEYKVFVNNNPNLYYKNTYWYLLNNWLIEFYLNFWSMIFSIYYLNL